MLFRPGRPTPADASPRARGRRGRAASSPRSRARERQGWAGRLARVAAKRLSAAAGRVWSAVSRGGVARNPAGSAEQASRHVTKKHLTKRNVAGVEASPRARLGRRKPQRERTASAVGRLDKPDRRADGQGYVLVEDGGRPWILIVMEFVVSSAKSLLKSKLTVPVNETRGPEMLPKLPVRWNVSTTSAFAPGAANKASAATALVDASRLAHEGSDLCPPASAPNCFISAPTQPPEGPPYGLFALHH